MTPEKILTHFDALINFSKFTLDAKKAMQNILSANPNINNAKLTALYIKFPVDALYAIKTIRYGPKQDDHARQVNTPIENDPKIVFLYFGVYVNLNMFLSVIK